MKVYQKTQEKPNFFIKFAGDLFAAFVVTLLVLMTVGFLILSV
ncbi:hypothetical protein ACFVIX_06680 [Bacillus subtilis]|nr:hypothetical protein [Bacillus subtilis]MCB4341692.1 hypothetical protein [Bacillus subtilis]MCT6515320.1 hypothetical protein [Bacillus subtilis]